MREFSKFPFASWLKLEPLNYLYKHLRNKTLMKIYSRKRQPFLNEFLSKCANLKNKNIILVTAFEQPWAIEWQIIMAKKYIDDAVVLIFDNSKSIKLRDQIKSVCDRNKTLYLPLPTNPTRHVNRSHALAMQWVYENVVRAIEPKNFIYIDHDLIPVKKISITNLMRNQDFYGLLKDKSRNDPGSWSIWAGYTMFKYEATKDKELNFMYDFSRDLDTGGGNFEPLYSFYDRHKMHFATKEWVSLNIPKIGRIDKLQLLDGSWHHIGSISYNNNFASRKDYCEALSKTINDGFNWDDLLIK